MSWNRVGSLNVVRGWGKGRMLLPTTVSPAHGSYKQLPASSPCSKYPSQMRLYSGIASLVVLSIIYGFHGSQYDGQRGDLDIPYSTKAQSMLKGSRKELIDKGQHQTSFPASQLKSLVLVACHSVYTGIDYSHPEDASSWALLEYQKNTPGQTHSFVEHIKLGVEEATKDAESLLLFSGGQTRKDAGPRAESMGYWMVAEAHDWFGHKDVRLRAFTEEHSRDSLENVMFSLCRFYELTGRYPEMMTIISYEFKEQRFVNLHRKTIAWPTARMKFVGTPALDPEARIGEEKTRLLFENDPFGCDGELAKKRLLRDPFGNGGYNADRCPAMKPLLDMATCDSDGTLNGTLPWI